MLHKSDVIFNQEAHTYTLNGKKLKGITGLISKHLFPNKYSDVPEHVLEKAKERGKLIHESCELVDTLGVEPNCIEAENYLKIKAENALKTIANEYLVSDNESFATMIDVVFEDSIADIKTTSILDRDYLSWQLSICAYFFELNNKKKIKKLYGIWLKNEKAELVEIPRKPDEVIKELLLCEVEGREFINPLVPASESQEVARLVEVESEIIGLKKLIDHYEGIKKELAKGLEAEMEKNGVKTLETERLKITRILPTVAKTFDKKSFEKEYPDLCVRYTKEQKKAGSVRITLKECLV